MGQCAVGVCSSPVHCKEIGRCFSSPAGVPRPDVAKDLYTALLSFEESYNLMKENLPPGVFSMVSGYFHGVPQETTLALEAYRKSVTK